MKNNIFLTIYRDEKKSSSKAPTSGSRHLIEIFGEGLELELVIKSIIYTDGSTCGLIHNFVLQVQTSF